MASQRSSGKEIVAALGILFGAGIAWLVGVAFAIAVPLVMVLLILKAFGVF